MCSACAVVCVQAWNGSTHNGTHKITWPTRSDSTPYAHRHCSHLTSPLLLCAHVYAFDVRAHARREHVGNAAVVPRSLFLSGGFLYPCRARVRVACFLLFRCRSSVYRN